ncbi:MAG: arginine--tRNA ligase [Thermoplasmatota archaeon]
MEYPLLEFEEEIKGSVKELLGVEEVPLEIPSEERGDYALPCFMYAGELKRSPQDIAEDIAENIELRSGTAQPMGPYVNFKIDDELLATKTLGLAEDMRDGYGKMDDKNVKVTIEHTSANPNAPLHVGNARNPIVGDTLARIYKKMGYDVETQYYVDDMGRQVAMTASGLDHLDEEKNVILYGEDKKIEFDHSDIKTEADKIAKIYQTVSKFAGRSTKEDEVIVDDIRNLINKVEEDPYHLRETSEMVMGIIKRSLKRLNVIHDTYKSESELVASGRVAEILEELEKTGACGFEEGAQFIEIDDKRVYLKRSDGTSLYPGRDIAYHAWKAESCEKQIDVLGEDHKLHAKSIVKALSLLGIEPSPDFVFHSFVTFEGEGMSTRAGTSIPLDDFMDKARDKSKEEILKRRDELAPEVVNDIAEKVGIGAVRFNIIKVQPEKPIDFKWHEALNFQGDSAPFVQYSYARACGILEKYGAGEDEKDILKLDEEGEIRLIKKMADYPITLKKAGDNNAPHILAKYARELASEFNQFYRDHPVLKSEDKRAERVALVRAFSSVMKSVLNTLGIEAPEEM